MDNGRVLLVHPMPRKGRRAVKAARAREEALKAERRMGEVLRGKELTEVKDFVVAHSTNLKPRKIDLLSPTQVKIETSTGESAFQDITTFRLFNETYQGYMLQMEGITKNSSASKKRKADSNWCLEKLAEKFGIDPSSSSAPVLKEHVALRA